MNIKTVHSLKQLAITRARLTRKNTPYILSLTLLFGIATAVTAITALSTSVEPEAATLSSKVARRSDTSAVGGEYVQFGASNTPTFQPTAPYHATFFYPWYKNPATDGSYSYWQDGGNNPPNTWFGHYLPDINTSAFDPATELYSSNDYNTFKWQLTKMAEARQEVAIASWFGQGSKQDTAIQTYVHDFMQRSDNPYPNLRWALYYECEGITTSGSPQCPSSTANPTVAQLVADLNHIKDNISDSPYFLRINGKPVIFVYGATEDQNTLVRWADANQQVGNHFYVVQKVFSGYATASPQPDSWHQYAPATNYGSHGTYSAYVSPGFWLDVSDPVDGAVRLARDLSRFQNDVTQLVNANVTWKLVQTWNEWGEGSSVEPGIQTRINSSGNEVADSNGAPFGNAYVQALADRLPALEQGVGTPGSGGSTGGGTGGGGGGSTPPSGSFVFTSGGDLGANSTTAASLALLDTTSSSFFIAVGDMDYDETSSDAAWCDYVKTRMPNHFSNPNFPFQLVTGNHEEQGGVDGYIMNHAACLPDRMNSTGFYPAQYYFDYPANNPLMRVIMISADLTVEGVDYNYTSGSAHTTWLINAIDSARAAGIPWVTIGTHKVCISSGTKPCELGEYFVNLLVSKKVDLLINGHEHNYQRTKQLAHGSGCSSVSSSSYNANCVVANPNSSTYTKGAGLITLINGNFGRSGSSYPISTSDPSYPYMIVANADSANRGFMKWTVTADRIDAQYMPSAGALTDSFSIIGGQ